MKKIGNLVFLLLIVCSLKSFSADIKVEAKPDRTQMGLGESVTLVVKVNSNEDFELDGQPRISPPTGFELINAFQGGVQSSSGMSVINGEVQYKKSVTQTFNYQFSPQKEGTILFPSVEVTIKGQIYRSEPVKIEVDEKFRGHLAKKGKNVPGRPQFPGVDDEDFPGGAGAFGIDEEEDIFSQLLKQRQKMFDQMNRPGTGQPFGQPQQIPTKQLDINTNESFFVWLEVDKNEVFEGEQITANWYIYAKGNLESLDRVKFPDLKGFWKEIIEEVPSLQFTREMVNGVLYNKALLASHALFPIKSGTAVIDEFKIKGKTRTLTQMGWGQPFESTKVSKKLSIKVLPLPTEGRTPQFSGAVGTYRVSLSTEGKSYPAHQPFTIKVRFEGLGNAKLIDLPQIQWPDSIEVYDTKSDSKFFKDGQSFKEFEILVIPRKEGPLQIPSMTFTYFDPAQKKYVSQITEPVPLTITEGQAQSGQNNTLSKNSPVEKINNEFIANPVLEWPQSSFRFHQVKLPLYISMAFLIFLFTFAQFTRQMKYLKVEKSFAEIILMRLKNLEEQKDHKKISAEGLNLIYLLGAQLAGSKKADQEWGNLTAEIPLQYQNKYLTSLNQLFDYFQLLGFSPDHVRDKLLQQKPIAEQIVGLKKISNEIAQESKAD